MRAKLEKLCEGALADRWPLRDDLLQGAHAEPADRPVMTCAERVECLERARREVRQREEEGGQGRRSEHAWRR
jgi:hypothetical protein